MVIDGTMQGALPNVPFAMPQVPRNIFSSDRDCLRLSLTRKNKQKQPDWNNTSDLRLLTAIYWS